MEDDASTTNDEFLNENDLVLATEDDSYDKSSNLDGTIDADPKASMAHFIS